MNKLLNKILFMTILIISIIGLFFLNKSWISSWIFNNNFVKYWILNGLLIFTISIIIQNMKHYFTNNPFIDFSDFLLLCEHRQVKKVVIYNNFLKCFLINDDTPKDIVEKILQNKELREVTSIHGINDRDPLKLKNAYMVYFPKNYFNFIDIIINQTKITFDSMGFISDFFWLFYVIPMVLKR
jgi:hypothetical protein